MRVEIVLSADYIERGAQIIQAMIAAAPVEVVVSKRYQAAGDVLMMYGCGHLERAQWWQQHRATGGRCIAWDLGYWHRQQGFMRCSIDHIHPQAMMRAEPATRWDAAQISLRNDWDHRGPVIVVGVGRKSQRQFGLAVNEWERDAVARARQAWPTHEVVFRPKRERDGGLAGVRTATGPIEDVLRGASLVVCRHSNVAIDACIAGIPVVCEDGAAAAVYGAEIGRWQILKLGARYQFLQSLAWWQWRADEARDAWRYLLERLDG